MAKIRDNTKEVLSEVDKLISQKLKLSALLVERTAKQICPVDTGTLKRSINRRIEKRKAIVGTNVEYAPYVEMGTPKRPNYPMQPFLRPALYAKWGEIKRIFGG